MCCAAIDKYRAKQEKGVNLDNQIQVGHNVEIGRTP
jgi:UDP-3-O-[3-hydroxymyristoyl] glucosamine N-acyltransferase